MNKYVCMLYCFTESVIRLQLMRQMYEVAQCCSEKLGRFQSAIYIWILPVVVKLLCDCNGEVRTLYAVFKKQPTRFFHHNFGK